MTGCNDLRDPKRLRPSGKLISVYSIAIKDQIRRFFVHTTGLDQLLRSPGGCWIVGYIEMQHPTTVTAENDEHEKNFEADG